jgi:hypothetical protein
MDRTPEFAIRLAYDICVQFGRRVGDIVLALSHDPGIPGYARRKAALRSQVANPERTR